MTTAKEKMMVAVSLESEADKASDAKMPLHVTVVAPFEIDNEKVDPFAQEFTRTVAGIEQFTIVGNGEDYFGEERNIRVRKIAHGAIVSAHEVLVRLVKEYTDGLDGRYAESNYAPHSSYHGKHGFEAGDTKEVTALDLYHRVGELWRIREHAPLRAVEVDPGIIELSVFPQDKGFYVE